MRSLVLLVAIALVGALGGTSSPAARRPVAAAAGASPRVLVRPATVDLYGRSTITVSGLDVASLEVRLVGATDPAGRPLAWRSLSMVGSVWRGELPTPAWHGLYPIELHTTPGAPIIKTQRFLRVFESGTRARPSFGDPAAAVRWWVRTVAHGTVVALRPWPRPAFDRRDPRLHRVFVVAYSLPGDQAVEDRLGVFASAVRDGYHGGWRLLEATVEP